MAIEFDRTKFIPLFKSEAQEHLEKLNKGLLSLEKNPDDLEQIKMLFRETHTLKGSAKMLGFDEINQLSHRIEDIFAKLQEKEIRFSSQLADKIFKALDLIKLILDKIVKNEKIDLELSGIYQELQAIISKEKVKELEPTAEVFPSYVSQREGTRVEEFIRVSTYRINKLLNLVGEIVINKVRSAYKINSLKRLAGLSKELCKQLSELTEELKSQTNGRRLEIMHQCNLKASKIHEESADLFEYIGQESFRMDPVIDELQQRVKEIRMLPCSTLFEAFPRMIRDLSHAKEKEVTLTIEGAQTELDKKVLDQIKPSLIHILRNCVDHGIELPAERLKKGKPREGKINIRAYQQGDNVNIEIQDDGGGIDPKKVKEVAVKKHIITEEVASQMTDEESLNLIFASGFSTSTLITDTSGRGVGLDVVRQDIESLRGGFCVESKKDMGTKITLTLPLSVALVSVLLLRCVSQIFALPVFFIEECVRIESKEIQTIEERMAIQLRGHTLPVVSLASVLALTATSTEIEKKPKSKLLSVVIINALGKRIGFIVDKILREEEVFRKGLGGYLGKVRNVDGVAILGTGEIVVILDVADLVESARIFHPVIRTPEPALTLEGKKRKILVVEDSLTTRELERSILESHGYEVDIAVDGLEAMDKLVKAIPHLIIVDLHMPRMDGFQFCSALKQNPRYKDIPVVIVTALATDEDKRRGIEVGAQAYIVKGGFDQTNLLDTIERLVR